MPGWLLNDFHSLSPRTDARLLRLNGATVAHDVKLWHGTLNTWRISDPISTRANDIHTIFNTEGPCGVITFPIRVDTEWGVPTDQFDKQHYLITRNAPFPQFSTVQECANLFRLGVPCPGGAPSISSSASPDCATYATAVYTYVNRFGHEGPPSAPSNKVPSDATGATVAGIAGPPAGYEIDRIRVYVAYDGYESGIDQIGYNSSYGLVGTFPVGAGSVGVGGALEFEDALMTHDWFPPPDDLINITRIDQGLFVGSVGNVLKVSAPRQPHAWPGTLDKTLDHDIVAIGSYENNVYIATTGKPYWGKVEVNSRGGVFMTIRPIEMTLPCVSRWGAVVGASGFIYPSPTGYVHMKTTEDSVITHVLFAEDDWCEIQPETMRSEIYRTSLYFTTDVGSWRFEFGDSTHDPLTNPLLTTLSTEPITWYRDRFDVMYYSEGNELFIWDPVKGGRKTPFLWRSKRLVEAGLHNFAAAKVVHDNQLETEDDFLYFRLWRWDCGEYKIIFERDITHCCPFRLPLCQLSIEDIIELEGTLCVHEVHLATSMEDLVEVNSQQGRLTR